MASLGRREPGEEGVSLARHRRCLSIHREWGQSPPQHTRVSASTDARVPSGNGLGLTPNPRAPLCLGLTPRGQLLTPRKQLLRCAEKSRPKKVHVRLLWMRLLGKCLLLHLKGRVTGKGTEGYLPCTGSLPRWGQALRPGRPVGAGLSTGAVFRCFPRCVSGELAGKQSDPPVLRYRRWWPRQQLTRRARAPAQGAVRYGRSPRVFPVVG